MARGTPCAPGFLFGLAGACPSGLRAFPAVGFAYTGGCVEAVRLRSKAQPGGLGLGHRSSNFSLESLRKYDLESQLRLRGMPCANAHGDLQNPGLLGNMDVGAGRRSWNFSGSRKTDSTRCSWACLSGCEGFSPSFLSWRKPSVRGGGIGGGKWGASLVTSSPSVSNLLMQLHKCGQRKITLALL